MSAAPNLPESVVEAGTRQSPAEATPNGAKPGDSTDASGAFRLHETPIENFRPIKVIVIGAGFSGIYCGVRIPERIRNIDLVIYDKNSGVGGTWWENRYPGCACDIPSHSYQYSFNPNKEWSALYAPAKEIHAYLESTVKKYSVDRFIKLSHRVEECRFDEAAGKWNLKITDLNVRRDFHDSADILINARGGLNDISWPDIEGLNAFQGEIMHSARWNESHDFKKQRIGIIGSGSSSIQIVPRLQELPDTQLSVFARSPMWISPPFGQELWDELGIQGYQFSREQIEEFVNNPEAYHEFRLKVEAGGNGIHSFSIKNTPANKGAREFFEKTMRERLAKQPELAEDLIPNFAPGCRRLTPGPGYLEALTETNVELVKSPVTRVEPEGIVTEDGRLHKIDVLVCATGFHSAAPPPFPVIGVGGNTLEEHWERYPRSYLSLATDGFPNHFMMLGPNAAIGTGSLTMMIESTGDYIVKCIRKLQKENLKLMSVKQARVSDFVDYAVAYFPRTVYSDNCRAWYKHRVFNEVTGLWPGSTLHCIEALRSPRWEDWDYESLDGEQYRNKMAWLGNGWCFNQLPGQERHLAWYLYPEFEEIPVSPLPEKNERFKIRPFSH